VPASGIKGALTHRLAYHYNRRAGRFADQVSGPDDEIFETEKNPAVRALFGYAKDRPDTSGNDGKAADTGRAGAVLIDDVALPVNPEDLARLAHNSIDRFTGGVRDGVLFTEEVIFGGTFPLHIRIRKSAWEGADAHTRQAFRDAIHDLSAGRLTLGAAGAKGHGGCAGRIVDSNMEEFTP
jgi:CRISPR/Cas system CMR subunit Cmr4 (Cas7 group RAMP superfamily)